MSLPPFHLAIPVHDLEDARAFYGGLLGCPEGRSAARWVDFDWFGHQLVVHLVNHPSEHAGTNPVDGHGVPVPHFGLVLPWDTWHERVEHLRQAGVSFVIEPGIRFQGLPGEQATCFFLDPSGNAIELKAFADPSALFRT